MTPPQIIGQIRAIIGMDPGATDEDLPKAVKSWGCRREADGIGEGRHMELMHQLGGERH